MISTENSVAVLKLRERFYKLVVAKSTLEKRFERAFMILKQINPINSQSV